MSKSIEVQLRPGIRIWDSCMATEDRNCPDPDEGRRVLSGITGGLHVQSA